MSKKEKKSRSDEGWKESSESNIKDGSQCRVTGGTHAGKSGTVRDLNISKTGHLTITVVQANGVRFKTLARNVEAI
jgi:ribosomal protein S4E